MAAIPPLLPTRLKGTGAIAEGFAYYTTGSYTTMTTTPAPKIPEGYILSRAADGKLELATAAGNTHVNEFTVLKETKLENQAKVAVFRPYAVVMVIVAEGETATPGYDAVISASDGCAKDRTAEPPAKICGRFYPSMAAINSFDVPEAPTVGAVGGTPVLMEILPKNYVVGPG